NTVPPSHGAIACLISISSTSSSALPRCWHWANATSNARAARSACSRRILLEYGIHVVLVGDTGHAKFGRSAALHEGGGYIAPEVARQQLSRRDTPARRTRACPGIRRGPRHRQVCPDPAPGRGHG